MDFHHFHLPKPLIFSSVVDHFFDHILRPPLEESFDPSWPPKLPTEPLKVDFGTFVGPFWGSEWILGDQSRPEGSQKARPSSQPGASGSCLGRQAADLASQRRILNISGTHHSLQMAP